MGLFGNKRPRLPNYVGASLETLLEDPQWSFAIGEAGFDPTRCEVLLRLTDCTIGDRGTPENASPALLLGQGNMLAVAFPGEREVRVVKRDTSRAELQTQRSGMFQILFGPVSTLDAFMFYGLEDNLRLDTPEGDQFGKAMSAFLKGNLHPQQVVGTPQSLIESISSGTSPQTSSAPDFDDPEDATRWQMVHTVYSALTALTDTYQLCFEKAENVEKAYSMTTVGHEISRENFRKHAVGMEEELEGLLLNLRETTLAAQGKWNDLMFFLPGDENEIMRLANWCMANGVDTDVMSSVAGNGMFIPTDFGTSRASFWAENERIIAVMNNANQQG
jgi:hypothetical protein